MALQEDAQQLAHEHAVLLRRYGELQRRWTELARRKTEEIERLQTQLMRLRARLILQGSMLAWEREDHPRPPDAAQPPNGGRLITSEASPIAPELAVQWLTHGLLAVDLVMCQTGCVSHGDFWREDDHCKRLGQTCVRVDHPEAVPVSALARTAPAKDPS